MTNWTNVNNSVLRTRFLLLRSRNEESGALREHVAKLSNLSYTPKLFHHFATFLIFYRHIRCNKTQYGFIRNK